MIQPGNGRIVHYHPHYPHAAALAAIVVGVHDERCVNLTVFHEDGSLFPALEVPLLQDDDAAPEGKAYAEWMAFQKGQAPASSAVTEQLAKVAASVAEHAKLLETGGTVHTLFTDMASHVVRQFSELEARLVAAGVQLQPAPAPAPNLPAPSQAQVPEGGSISEGAGSSGTAEAQGQQQPHLAQAGAEPNPAQQPDPAQQGGAGQQQAAT